MVGFFPSLVITSERSLRFSDGSAVNMFVCVWFCLLTRSPCIINTPRVSFYPAAVWSEVTPQETSDPAEISTATRARGVKVVIQSQEGVKTGLIVTEGPLITATDTWNTKHKGQNWFQCWSSDPGLQWDTRWTHTDEPEFGSNQQS